MARPPRDGTTASVVRIPHDFTHPFFISLAGMLHCLQVIYFTERTGKTNAAYLQHLASGTQLLLPFPAVEATIRLVCFPPSIRAACLLFDRQRFKVEEFFIRQRLFSEIHSGILIELSVNCAQCSTCFVHSSLVQNYVLVQ